MCAVIAADMPGILVVPDIAGMLSLPLVAGIPVIPPIALESVRAAIMPVLPAAVVLSALA